MYECICEDVGIHLEVMFFFVLAPFFPLSLPDQRIYFNERSVYAKKYLTQVIKLSREIFLCKSDWYDFLLFYLTLRPISKCFEPHSALPLLQIRSLLCIENPSLYLHSANFQFKSDICLC